jgi:NTE family protein
METDLVLSSGFLAFARQTGVLSAVEDSGIEVGGVCGTSSGALAGALWCAGHSAKTVADKLSVQTPLSMLRPGIHMWRGLFSMRAVLSQLRDWLPPTFADLDRPFAVGVMGPSGEAVLLRDGPLPEAVAASCSIPWLFQPIEVDGVMCTEMAVRWIGRRLRVGAPGEGTAPPYFTLLNGLAELWLKSRRSPRACV